MRLQSHSLAALAVASALVFGCAAGAPPGFSDGTMWSLPLVAPLENGALIVPVQINGKGPYLFMIDPDSEKSSVDNAMVGELELYPVPATEVLDEADTKQIIANVEVKRLQVGNLSVRNMAVHVHKAGTYWFSGRLIRGVIGRDIIADSLIFAVDRDRGMVYLATQGNMKPPAGATKIGARVHRNRFSAHDTSRYLVRGMVNKATKFYFHLDFGAPFSMLWPSAIEKAKLPVLKISTTLHDEFGTAREVASGAITAKLAVGELEQSGLMVLPYADKRWRKQDLDGVIGNNFLSRYNVTVNWHKKAFWFKPRVADLGEMATERLRRWGASADRCKTPACVTVVIAKPVAAPAAPEPPAPEPPPAVAAPIAPDDAATSGEGTPVSPAPAPAPTPAPAPPAPPVVEGPSTTTITVTREEWTRDLTFDAMLEAMNADGTPIGLPLMRVTFPIGQLEITVDRGVDMYQAAHGFRVVDWSPFPRECDPGGNCMWTVRPPR